MEEQKELDEQLLDVGPATNKLPDVPRAEPAKPQAAKARKEEEACCVGAAVPYSMVQYLTV